MPDDLGSLADLELPRFSNEPQLHARFVMGDETFLCLGQAEGINDFDLLLSSSEPLLGLQLFADGFGDAGNLGPCWGNDQRGLPRGDRRGVCAAVRRIAGRSY